MRDLTTGLTCAGTLMNCIIYADDILIISTDKELADKGMNHLVPLCAKVGLKISKEKSKVVCKKIKDKVEGEESEGLEEVLMQAYLGVEMVIGRQVNFLGSRVNIAMKYFISCKSLANSSPDPVLFATTIWFRVAIPSILYGTESVILSTEEIMKIEGIQSNLGKFVLQLHGKAANVLANLLAGFKPFQTIYYERVLKYYCTMKNYDDSHWAKKALLENERMGMDSEYTKRIGEIWSLLGWDGEESTITYYANRHGTQYINKERKDHYASCKLLPKSSPDKMTHKSKMLGFDVYSRAFNEFVTYDAGLGNRKPIHGEEPIKICVLCRNDGLLKDGGEEHLLFGCKAMEEARNYLGMSSQLGPDENSLHNDSEKYKLFWYKKMSTGDLKRRIQLAMEMRDIYLDAVGEILKR